MALEFWLWPMPPWLSPGAAWFIFFNAVVGAIAVISRAQGGHAMTITQRKLARIASTVIIESLRSISIFSFHSGIDYSIVSPPAWQLHHVQYPYMSQEQGADEVRRVVPELGLRILEPAPVSEEIGMAPTAVLPSAPAAAADAEASASETAEEEMEEDGESISLDEAYTLARAQRQSPVAVAPATDTVARRPMKRETVKTAEVKRCAYACGRGAEEVEAKGVVNVRAERFIRQFREELKLERLNSILNHTSALHGGGGGGTAAAR